MLTSHRPGTATQLRNAINPAHHPQSTSYGAGPHSSSSNRSQDAASYPQNPYTAKLLTMALQKHTFLESKQAPPTQTQDLNTPSSTNNNCDNGTQTVKPTSSQFAPRASGSHFADQRLSQYNGQTTGAPLPTSLSSNPNPPAARLSVYPSYMNTTQIRNSPPYSYSQVAPMQPPTSTNQSQPSQTATTESNSVQGLYVDAQKQGPLSNVTEESTEMDHQSVGLTLLNLCSAARQVNNDPTLIKPSQAPSDVLKSIPFPSSKQPLPSPPSVSSALSSILAAAEGLKACATVSISPSKRGLPSPTLSSSSLSESVSSSNHSCDAESSNSERSTKRHKTGKRKASTTKTTASSATSFHYNTANGASLKKGKGSWSPEEDAIILAKVAEFGLDWPKIFEFLPGRTTKQIRERWMNNLDPNLKKDFRWTEKEKHLLIDAFRRFPNRWVQISSMVPGRSANDVKNHWHSRDMKRLLAEEGIMF